MMETINRLPLLSFLWPSMLWLLALVLACGAGYVWLDRRRRRVAVSFPTLRTVGPAPTAVSGWRRHLSPVLILLALAALTLAVARPQAVMVLPSHIETVVLVMDLSGSMRAQDVKPSRIRAAQQAAQILLDEKPAAVSVAVVAMAATAAVSQAPSRSKEDVMTAIENLKPQGGTALGNGLLVALTTLLPQSTADAERMMNEDPVLPRRPGADDADAVAPGSYAQGAIVVFSDGESNAGPAAVQAAELAATYGVRIFTVGVGTSEGTVLKVDGLSSRVRLDEAVLKQVAERTNAEYFRLEDAAALKKVYRELNARLTMGKRDQVEITAFFAALGALLAALGGLVSLWWFGRVA
ncbi:MULTISPECIES: vWA domain-containing protein [unclassified Cupriavidus]|uniref:vWA domain-containing protein n=1 Tax=Cupriavidus sp. H19C3 TaxID=3241603 RepID=UPI003BF8335B